MSGQKIYQVDALLQQIAMGQGDGQCEGGGVKRPGLMGIAAER